MKYVEASTSGGYASIAHGEKPSGLAPAKASVKRFEKPRAGCESCAFGVQLIGGRISRRVGRGSQRFIGRPHG